MERFTNNPSKYREEIISELSTFDTENWKLEFIFLELTQLTDYGFSVRFEKHKVKDHYRMMLKKWEAAKNFKNNNLGIYNLDRLVIDEKELRLSDGNKETFQLLMLNKKTLGTVTPEGIALDGLTCVLTIPSASMKLEWNLDQEMNGVLASLIIRLRAMVYKK